ncbi:hypothetical protein BGX31_010682 [Mortierella sp. GBA43]|nr:hypothetical protein BGX31_010682 [Mortierella sp. GBA43]
MEQLQVENAKNKERWERLTQTQETILRNQDQALNQLNVIQGRIQAVVTQTFELHEFSIPRLFIVLPKSLRLVDKLKGVFSDQFRLYFLCECGKHTTSDGTKQRHHIHLAKHEGYDLERPTAFFEKYGLYVRTVMQMIKIGISTAGLFLPPLNAPKLIDNIDAEKHMGFIKTNFSSLIDDSIAFLDDNLKSTEASDELIDGDTYFDQLEALEGANLRQLESYLKLKDQERVLGNLFRIVTSEGHVKWVCSDHYQASYRASALEQLQDVIKVNLGKYIEKRGRIEIEIASSALAKQFYDAMAKARGIQELEITLKWDVTMDDLRKLSKAVTNANVHRLTMDGSHFKTPALDIVNIHRRFDPIVSSIARTHSFYLKGFEDFFARVSTLPAAPMPNLRVLSIDCGILLDKKAIRSLNGLLERCPALTVLELGLCDRDSMIVASSDRIKMPPTLKSLKLNHGGLFVNARLTEGQIQGAILTVDRLDRLSVDDLNILIKWGMKIDCLGSLKGISLTFEPDAEVTSVYQLQQHHSGSSKN